MRGAQNLRPNLGTTVGQSPTHLREQTKGPTARNAPGVERAKGTGLGGEKTKGTANYCLLLLQRSKDKAGDEKELQEKTPTETVGQEEINNSERGMSREEGRISREAKGKQKEEREALSRFRNGNRFPVSFWETLCHVLLRMWAGQNRFLLLGR